jgi:hypothetical protein
VILPLPEEAIVTDEGRTVEQVVNVSSESGRSEEVAGEVAAADESEME